MRLKEQPFPEYLPFSNNLNTPALHTNKSTGERKFFKVVRAIAITYLIWCSLVFFMQEKLLYMPQHAGNGFSEAEITAENDIERLLITQIDGAATEAWILRSRERPSRGLVCFLHGNAELIDDTLAEAHAWNTRGMDVLLPEYRGYGRTVGSPSQIVIVQDVSEAIRVTMARTNNNILILHGRSIGTGVAAQVAVLWSDKLERLILESPFTSIASFAWKYGVPPVLVTNPYRTDDVLPHLACPILIVHARDDEIIPIQHGRTLAALNPNARLVEMNGSHNSGLSQMNEYWEAIDEMLKSKSESSR